MIASDNDNIAASLNIMEDMLHKTQELEASKLAYINIINDIESKNNELKGMQQVLLNVTEDLENQRNELASTKAYAEGIVKSVSEILLVLGVDWTIKDVNEAACKALGYTKDELIGKQFLWTVMAEAEDSLAFNQKHEKTFITKEGVKIPCLVSVSAILDASKQASGIVCVATDITDRKKIEDDVREQLKETTSSLIQSEKLAALGELTASITHELKQPMNTIKLICQSILRDNQKGRLELDALTANLSDVVSEVNRMSEIIDHMRIFSRRTDASAMEPRNINEIFEASCKFISRQLSVHNIALVKELAADLPAVKCDPIQLEQVITNLLNNARQAFDSKEMDTKNIEIRTYKLDKLKSPLKRESVAISIKDNAGGIPEDVEKKLFTAFFTTKDPARGTGLGLSISKRIVETHKGCIELDNKAGESANFIVTLPAYIVDELH